MDKQDRLSERLLEILYNSSIVGSYIYDIEGGEILFANNAFCKLIGYAKEQCSSMNVYGIIDDYDYQKKLSDIEWLNGKSSSVEQREIFYKAKDGSVRLCQNYSYSLEFNRKSARFVTVLDKTEDKIYETLYKVLSDVNQIIVKTNREDELLNYVCKTLSGNLGFDVVAVGVIDDDTKLFYFKYAYGKEEIFESLKEIKISVDEFDKRGQGSVGRAYRSKKIVIVRDVYKEKGMDVFKELFKTMGIRSVCSIPLFKNKKIKYILLIHSHTPTLFSERHKRLLEEMQSDVCFALDRLENEKEQKLFVESFEKSPAWIVVTDKEGNITRVNQTVIDTTGYTKEELMGENPRIFKSGEHPDEFYKDMWETITKGKTFRCELTNKTKSGSFLYLDTIIMPISYNQEIIRYVNVSRDITNEVKQRKRIEKLSRLYKTMSDVGSLLLISQGERQILDRLPKTILKNNDFSLTFVVKKGDSRKFEVVSKAAEQENMLDFLDYIEKQIDLKNQAIEHCLFAKSIKHGKVYTENNIDENLSIKDFRLEFEKFGLLSSFSLPIIKHNKILGALVGISQQKNFFDNETYQLLKKIQYMLTYSFDKFETERWHDIFTKATNLGFDALVVTDKDFRIVYVSDGVVEQSGYSKEEIIGAHHSIFSSKTHTKEFREKFYSKLKSGKPYSGIMTYRGKNRKLFNFLVNIVPYKIDGKIEYYVGVGKDITEQKSLQEALDNVLTHDSLTGLLNRSAFLKKTGEFVSRITYKRMIGAMCVINPLKLSEVNQAFGFETGDAILQQIADRLKKYLKTYDAVGKLESDKFAVFLEDLKTEEDALVTIMNLIEKLSKSFRLDGKTIRMFFNAGVSLYPSDAYNAEELLEKAEIALLDARDRGKNSIGFYREKFKQEAEKRLSLKTDIRKALKNMEFVLHYQPYFDTQTHKIAGAEALIRWEKDGRIIPPIEFIPYLEEINMISEIEDWTTEYVPGKIKEWIDKGLNVVPISINISPDSFKNKDFVESIVVKTYNINPNLLNIEIIERLFIEQTEYAKETLDLLRQKGLHISMDDFGTGYSSLSYISNLPIDYLKIDISFVRKIVTDRNTHAVVKSIISLAKDIGMKTIAEGVETKEQLSILEQMGCNYIQGYLMSRPLKEIEFIKFLQ